MLVRTRLFLRVNSSFSVFSRFLIMSLEILFGRFVDFTPGLSSYGKTAMSSNFTSLMRSNDLLKSSSVSPGKPTSIWVSKSISGTLFCSWRRQSLASSIL